MRSLVITLILALTFGVSCANKGDKKADAPKAKASKAATKETSKATSSKKESVANVSCKLDTFTRDLAVVNPAEGGCEVLYTKDGETKTIANGNNVSDYCNEVFNRVKTKLESSGFTCQ